MPPPDLEARYEILCVHTRNMKVADDVDLRRIAADTELFTGAELEGLCREAGIVALREDISASVVCDRHFQTVKKSLKPSLTKAEIESYSSFTKGPLSVTSSHEIEPIAKNKHRGWNNLLGLMSPMTIGITSFVVFFAAKFFLMSTDQTPRELATT